MTAVGGFLGFVPKPGDDERLADQQSLTRRIYQMFLKCEKQQLASQTISDRVLDADFFWTTVVNTKKFEAKLPVDDYTYQVWVFFCSSIARAGHAVRVCIVQGCTATHQCTARSNGRQQEATPKRPWSKTDQAQATRATPQTYTLPRSGRHAGNDGRLGPGISYVAV